MPYTAEKPPLPESPEQLRARIPGWGVDADPQDRPSHPRERFDLPATGAHWEQPDRQPVSPARERSIEHAQLTPAYGTSCPMQGTSGAIRAYAYRRYSEARAAHWLLLLAADRVDVVEHRLRDLRSGRIGPLTETGLGTEVTRHGLRSRRGQGRADVVHHPMDVVVASGSTLLALGLVTRLVRRLRRRS